LHVFRIGAAAAILSISSIVKQPTRRSHAQAACSRRRRPKRGLRRVLLAAGLEALPVGLLLLAPSVEGPKEVIWQASA